jgi:hypothetical protein
MYIYEKLKILFTAEYVLNDTWDLGKEQGIRAGTLSGCFEGGWRN